MRFEAQCDHISLRQNAFQKLLLYQDIVQMYFNGSLENFNQQFDIMREKKIIFGGAKSSTWIGLVQPE